MNGEQVLNWMIEDANQNANNYYPDIWQCKLEDYLYELNSRREITLPQEISSNNLPDEKKLYR